MLSACQLKEELQGNKLFREECFCFVLPPCFFLFLSYSLHARKNGTLKFPFSRIRVTLDDFLPDFIVKLSRCLFSRVK